MIAFKQFVTLEKRSDTPVYLQIANSMILNIRQGRLRRGSKLPASREAAALLQVHRKTMLAAYEELHAQGWIEMIARKGTYVANDLPEIKPVKITEEETAGYYPAKTFFSFDEKYLGSLPVSDLQHTGKLIINDGFPDIRLAPIEPFMRELRSLAKQRGFRKYYGYGTPKGPLYFRETLASFLSETRGLPISPDNVMITRGAQMGIYLTGNLLLKTGDHVIVGEPGFFGATLTFQQLGATINRVPVDASGIQVDAIEKLCKRKKIRLVYVIPHHHHPTTVTLSPERRIRLLQLAEQYKFAIVEDDYDYDFHYTSNPVLPIASLDHRGSVIYIGTLSKTLAPAIRTGFIVAPENFIHATAHLRRWIDWQGDSMMEVAIAELYRNGTIGRHIKKVVKLYRERRDHFCTLLKDSLGDRITFKIPDGGMSVWTKFMDARVPDVSEWAAKKGLIMSNGKLYNMYTDLNATRLGFASLNFQEQNRAIEILAKATQAAAYQK